MKLIAITLALLTVGSNTNAAKLPSVGSANTATGRIINGVEAQVGEAPFIVSIQSVLGSHFCAGSIIDEHWVLTAAHCLDEPQYRIVAGLHTRGETSKTQIRKVTASNVVVHEKYVYNGRAGPYDIGLIYIDEAFDLNTLNRDDAAPVSKVALPSGRYTLTGTGRLFGWGRDNSGELSANLKVLDVNIIDYKQCKNELPIYSRPSSGNICSYTAGKSDGACNGDSGGPLVRTTNAGYELVGIVSWVITPCKLTKYPSVYTSTAVYESWINDKIANFVPA